MAMLWQELYYIALLPEVVSLLCGDWWFEDLTWMAGSMNDVAGLKLWILGIHFMWQGCLQGSQKENLKIISPGKGRLVSFPDVKSGLCFCEATLCVLLLEMWSMVLTTCSDTCCHYGIINLMAGRDENNNIVHYEVRDEQFKIVYYEKQLASLGLLFGCPKEIIIFVVFCNWVWILLLSSNSFQLRFYYFLCLMWLWYFLSLLDKFLFSSCGAPYTSLSWFCFYHNGNSRGCKSLRQASPSVSSRWPVHYSGESKSIFLGWSMTYFDCLTFFLTWRFLVIFRRYCVSYVGSNQMMSSSMSTIMWNSLMNGQLKQPFTCIWST